MKKRILSLFLTVALCISAQPMTTLAEEAGVVAEQEVQSEESAGEVYTVDGDISGGDIGSEDVSSGDPAVQDAALAEPVEVQAGGHTHYLCGGTVCNKAGGHTEDSMTSFTQKLWMDEGVLKINDTPLETTYLINSAIIGYGYELPAGNYYLEGDIILSYPIYIGQESSDKVVNLCLNGNTITAGGDFDAVILFRGTKNAVTFSLTDCRDTGKITHTAGKKGCGVYVYADYRVIFNMYGGSIIGNKEHINSSSDTSTFGGGGVYLGGSYNYTWAGCIFNMYDGTIADNSAANGGGIFMRNNEGNTFNMYGGSITGNTANGKGGGIYTNEYGSFYISGEVQITGNTKDGAANNVELAAGRTITIGEGGLADNARIGVTTENSPEQNRYVVIATGAADGSYKDGTFIDDKNNSDCKFQQKGDQIVLVNGELHEHAICGKTDCTDGHSNALWIPLTYDADTQTLKYGSQTVPSEVLGVVADYDENGQEKYAYYTKYTLPAGNYYLLNDISLTGGQAEHTGTGSMVTTQGGMIAIGENTDSVVSLCLNGKTLSTSMPYDSVIGVGENGTLTLSDCGDSGRITSDCKAFIGVQVSGSTDERQHGVFTMYGGTITGTQNGVQALRGIFNMYGGTITGNETGVDVSETSAVTVGGTVKIIDNTKENVFLSEWDGTKAIITIDEDLTNDAEIGVTTSAAPTAEAPIQIAAGATGSLKYTDIFKPDVTGQGYVVTRDEEGNLYLDLHRHSWGYAASGATITATCINADGTCPDPDGGSMTIKAPAEDTLTYDRRAKEAEIENNFITGESDPDISYRMGTGLAGNLPAGSFPRNAGEYTASITVGGATAEVTYTIKKAVPKADYFYLITNTELIYDGNVKTVEAKPISGIEGMGEATVKYYRDDKEQEFRDAGTYTVKIDVAEGSNYTAASELAYADWIVTIARNDTAPDVTLSGKMIYTGRQIRPGVTVTVNGTRLTEGEDYTITYGRNINAGTNAGRVTITAKGNYAFDEVEKRFTIERADQTLSFTASKVKKVYGDVDFINALTNSAEGKDEVTYTYASDNTSVATVDESTGKVTIVGAGTATITVTADETMNYKEGTASYTLTVDKAVIQIDSYSVHVADKYYDGNMTASVSSVSLVDKDNQPIAGLVYGTDYTATGEFPSPYVGHQLVYIKVTLGENLAKNYKLENDVCWANARISARPVSIVSATAEDRTYKLDDTSVKITGLTFKDNNNNIVTLTEGRDYTVTGGMEDANAGEDKDVIVIAKVSNGNYSLSDNTFITTVTIFKETPVIDAVTSQTLVKNGAAVDISGWAAFDNTDEGAALTYKLEGNPAGITLTGSRLTAADDASTVKEFNIKVSAAPTTNFEAPVEKTITVTVIEKADAGVQITAAMIGAIPAQEYTGSPIEPAFEVKDGTTRLIPGTDFDFTYSNNTNAGTATLIITGKGNYTGTAVVNWEITRADPTGEPAYTVITTEGRTLADVNLTLAGSNLSPAAGTLEWIDGEDNVLPGNTKVEANQSYKWRFTPADDNYTVLTGEIIPYPLYSIIDGADSTWTQDTDGTIVIRGNGAFAKFLNVKVDGVVIDAGNYAAAEGSTIITLKADYLKTLSEGSHTFELVWTDGSASTNFTVVATASDDKNDDDDSDDNTGNNDTAGSNSASNNNTVPGQITSPKTGDASGIWTTLFMISIAGFAAMLARRKK